MNKPIINVDHVTKSYGTSAPSLSLFLTVIDKLRLKRKKVFKALDDVTLHCNRGEIVGLVGRNGSGKTTLLKAICGITGTDQGKIHVEGRIVSLLEVGAGFSMRLTGRENIYLKASLFGVSKEFIDPKIEDIIAFSGVGAFIDMPLYQYSSGMFVRLGFSVAVFCNPSILIVDETLAVGDTEFQNKCIETIQQLKEQGTTILFVSHDLAIVNGMCDRVYLLENGKVLAEGKPQDVIPQYLQYASTEGVQIKERHGDYEYFFSDGNLSIFHKNKAITKLYGLYSSFFAYRSWHDSHQAAWKVKSHSTKKWVLLGQSRRLPLDFEWEIDFQSDNEITISQWVTPRSPITLDETQTSVLLAKDFAQWKIQNQNGLFPDVPDTGWNNWKTISFPSDTKSNEIQAISSTRNTHLTFSNQETNHAPFAIVTSKDFNSNVLQFLDSNPKQLHTHQRTLIFKGNLQFKS